MGAEKATATPIAAPAVTKSRLSLGFCGGVGVGGQEASTGK